MRFGAHVPGGVKSGVARAIEIGAECIQIFAAAPQSWRPPSHSDAAVEAFRRGCAEHGLSPVYLHGLYLLNFASENDELWQRSVEAALCHQQWADRLGAAGQIVHLGSGGAQTPAQARQRVIEAVRRILDRHTGQSRLLLETCAGQGNTIGRTFEELAEILAALDDPRLGVCLDTAHVFAAGYDVTTPEGLDETLRQLNTTAGLDRLWCLHANDSKAPRGSNIDRHENIGRGCIGEDGFRVILHHPALQHLPVILEVPGYDGQGPDRPNLEALRRLAGAA